MLTRRYAPIAAALALCAAPGTSLHAAPPAGLKQKVDAWVAVNQRAIVTELTRPMLPTVALLP